MKTRFVIIVNNATVVQENAISQYFKDGNFGYWHWFSHTWLVIDQTQTWTVALFRDKINELAPGVHNLVLKIDDPNAWAIRGLPDTFPWLHDDWSKK